MSRELTMILAMVAFVVLLLGACTHQQVIRGNPSPATKAEHDIPEDELLDVGIVIFDPGIPEDPEILENSFPEVRKAEARYIPYALRNTLEETGHWGATRVIPTETNSADVLLQGKIIESNGEALTLAVTVKDATGRVWLEQEYTHTASHYAYEDTRLGGQDPFQQLYNTVANDMLAAREPLRSEQIRQIRTVAELRFAADLSPQAFGSHVSQNESQRYEINRLPATDDPMLNRVRKIREREYMLVDTLDEHYAQFHRDMQPSYQEWRKNSYDEQKALQEVRRSARNRMLLGAAAVIGGILGASSSSSVASTAGTVAVIGGAAAFKSGLDKHAESKIHVEALRELGDSFDAELAPKVVDVEGKTVTLKGSAEAQYQEWRRLLREIYASETGFALPDQDSNTESEQGADRQEGSSETDP